MITLCGFAVSNYFNKVKIALLEKNIPFTLLRLWPRYRLSAQSKARSAKAQSSWTTWKLPTLHQR